MNTRGLKLEYLGLFGIISLISYTAMVVFSPLAYPGYNWLTMAVSDLGAVGAPSTELAHQLSALYGPCSVVSIMAVCIGVSGCASNYLKLGIGFFAVMEWVSEIGYKMFPWVQDEGALFFQNAMHISVTIIVVAFSILSMSLIAVGARIEGLTTLSNWALICFAIMIVGAIGTGIMPKSVFGLFERFSTFSTVIFNAILGLYLLRGDLNCDLI